MKKKWLQLLPEILGVSGVLALMLVIYNPVLSAEKLLSFDDDLLLFPLLGLDSLSEYFKLLAANKVLDLQPVRDLSFLIDFQLNKLLPFWSFHLSNLVVWLGVCLVYWSILARVVESRLTRNVVMLLVAMHPVMAISLSWIAARKHLLSALFTGLATRLLLEMPSDSGRGRILRGLGCSVLYTLAVFSQPIAILWPFWAALWLLFDPREACSKASARGLLALLPAFVVMVICFKLNWDYYNGPYQVQTGTNKIDQQFNLEFAILALGRYAYNVVIPSTVSVVYYHGALKNLIGLVILPVLLWVFLKTIEIRKLLVWGTFAAFPLAVVIERQNNIFVSDTYLAIPMLGLALLFSLAAVGLRGRFPVPSGYNKILSALGVLLLGFYVLESRGIARGMSSNDSLWDWASSVEKTPFSLSQQVVMELRKGDDEKALYHAQFFFNWQPEHMLAGRTLGWAVQAYRGWSDEEKIKFLEARWSPDPWLNYFLAGIYTKTGNHQKAYSFARNIVSRAMDLEESAEQISAEVTFLCYQAKAPECNLVEQQFMKSTAPRVLPWRHSIFEARMNALITRF